MGSPPNELGRQKDEVQHEVTISMPFYMGVVEVTHEQYMNIMHPDYVEVGYRKGFWGATGPAYFLGGPWNLDLNKFGKKAAMQSPWPMEMLTWNEAVAFAKWLTDREAAAGRLPKGCVYRLPTEAARMCTVRSASRVHFPQDLELPINGMRLVLAPELKAEQ